MGIKEKHCVCKEWKEKYAELVGEIFEFENSELYMAQERGERCPFCDKKLITEVRKTWVLIACPVICADNPEDAYEDQVMKYWIPLDELKNILSGKSIDSSKAVETS